MTIPLRAENLSVEREEPWMMVGAEEVLIRKEVVEAVLPLHAVVEVRAPSTPELTADQLAQLADAEGRPVNVTDPDAPELPPEAWTTGLEARRRRLAKPAKEAISIRLDADVLEWFRGQGPGYQREINRLLRERMEMTRGGR